MLTSKLPIHYTVLYSAEENRKLFIYLSINMLNTTVNLFYEESSLVTVTNGSLLEVRQNKIPIYVRTNVLRSGLQV